MWLESEYHLRINAWEGRLGNNIQQLCCAIFIAEKTDSCVTYCSHDIIANETISFLKNTDKNKIPEHKVVSKTFFQYASCCGELLPLYNDSEQRRICETYIRPLFRTILETPNVLKLRSTDLIIHLRSGDVFNTHTHGLYVQNPFSYYKTVLDEIFQGLNKWDKTRRVIVLTEPDKRNPCMPLINSYIQQLNIRFAIKFVGQNVNTPFEYIENIDLKTCINTLLTAENIVLANSSFSQRLSMCNTNLKNMYVSSLTIAEKASDCPRITVHFHKIKNYTKHGEWRNTSMQYENMKKHSIEDIEHLPIENAELPKHFIKGQL